MLRNLFIFSLNVHLVTKNELDFLGELLQSIVFIMLLPCSLGLISIISMKLFNYRWVILCPIRRLSTIFNISFFEYFVKM